MPRKKRSVRKLSKQGIFPGREVSTFINLFTLSYRARLELSTGTSDMLSAIKCVNQEIAIPGIEMEFNKNGGFSFKLHKDGDNTLLKVLIDRQTGNVRAKQTDVEKVLSEGYFQIAFFGLGESESSHLL